MLQTKKNKIVVDTRVYPWYFITIPKTNGGQYPGDEMENKIQATKSGNDGRQWYDVQGYHEGMGAAVDGEYAITEEGQILDCDGYPLTDGDRVTDTVRQAIEECDKRDAGDTNPDWYEMVTASYGDVVGEKDTAPNWIAQIESICHEMGWPEPELREISDGSYVNESGETVLKKCDKRYAGYTKSHRYLMTERPFSIGCQPTEGLVKYHESDKPRSRSGYYGIVEYDRELTTEEIQRYELVEDVIL